MRILAGTALLLFLHGVAAAQTWMVDTYTVNTPTTSFTVPLPNGVGEIRISGSYYFESQAPSAQPHFPCIRFNGSTSGYENLKFEIVQSVDGAFVPSFTDCGVIASDTHVPTPEHFKAWGNLVPLGERVMGSVSTSIELGGQFVPTADQNAFKWSNATDEITEIEFTTEYGSLFRGEFIVEYLLTGLTGQPPPPPPPPPASTIILVSSGSDDGTECNKGTVVSADWIASDGPCWGFARFVGSIPITSSAHIEFVAGLSISNSPNLAIHAEASCTSQPLQPLPGDIKNRVLSSNSVFYSASNLSGIVQTPDLSVVINEIAGSCGGTVAAIGILFVPSGGDFNMPSFEQGNPIKLVFQ